MLSSVDSIISFFVLQYVPSGTLYRLDKKLIVLSFLTVLVILDTSFVLAIELPMVLEIGRKCCFSSVNTSIGLFFVVLFFLLFPFSLSHYHSVTLHLLCTYF